MESSLPCDFLGIQRCPSLNKTLHTVCMAAHRCIMQHCAAYVRKKNGLTGKKIRHGISERPLVFVPFKNFPIDFNDFPMDVPFTKWKCLLKDEISGWLSKTILCHHLAFGVTLTIRQLYRQFLNVKTTQLKHNVTRHKISSSCVKNTWPSS